MSISLIVNFADSMQYLTSAEVIKSIPAPTQEPWTPAKTGTVHFSRVTIDSCQSFNKS